MCLTGAGPIHGKRLQTDSMLSHFRCVLRRPRVNFTRDADATGKVHKSNGILKGTKVLVVF